LAILTDLIGGSRAGDRGEPGGGAVNKLDAALAHDDIAGGPEPKPIDGFGSDQVLAGLDGLASEQGGHTRVKRAAQVGQPDLV